MKKILLAFLLVICQSLNSQNSSIVAEYDMFVNLGQSKHTVSKLLFKDGVSYYHWNNSKDNSSSETDDFGNSTFHVDITDSIGTINMIDYKVDSIYTRSLRFKDVIVLKEERPKIKWELIEEQKKIGNFISYKAKCKFRGRNYTVWYTTQIPSNIGPWKLNGLPGMILEAADDDRIIQMIFKSVRISNDEIEDISYIFEEGQFMNLKEYAESQNKLADDLVKKIASKLPRGATISIDSKTENYIEKNFND